MGLSHEKVGYCTGSLESGWISDVCSQEYIRFLIAFIRLETYDESNTYATTK
jgi:hypothetical protein